MLTSLVRTIVPMLWGAVVTWAIGIVPALAPMEGQLNGLADFAIPVIVAVIGGAWYALWRWLEPRLPDWLTRAVLGSAKTPSYGKPSLNPNQVMIQRDVLEGWPDTAPLTSSDWRKFAESLPASEQSTTLLSLADALAAAESSDYQGKHEAEKPATGGNAND